MNVPKRLAERRMSGMRQFGLAPDNGKAGKVGERHRRGFGPLHVAAQAGRHNAIVASGSAADSDQPIRGTEDEGGAALLHEFLHVAICTAMTGSIFNSLFIGGARTVPESSWEFVPPDPIVAKSIGWTARDFGAPESSDLTFERFILLVGQARDRGRRLSSALLPAREMEAALRTETLIWRGVADAGYEAARVVRDATLVPLDVRNQARVMGGTLDAVRDGGSPCIVDGKPLLPGWAQRRRFRRFMVNIEASLLLDGRAMKVVVLDASQGGLGISSPEHLATGMKVGVRMPMGRELNGTVAWTDGPKAGIQLCQPLACDDPLISSS